MRDSVPKESTQHTGYPAREATASAEFDWRTADYSEWNDRLLDYFLGIHRQGERVDQIPATPEELVAVTGDLNADVDDVTERFVEEIRESLRPRTTFCRFCLNYDGWSVESDRLPRFFAMLWFTCLLAAGYVDEHASFTERFRAVVGKVDHLRTSDGECLNQLWEDLALWSSRHPGFAKLELPPTDGFRSTIGRSYYLAFPNGRDRRVLGEILASASLLGFEPPILPVVRVVQKVRERFTNDFRAALDYFTEKFLHAGLDPKNSAFWRAIRTEALQDPTDTASPALRKVTFVASWDDDDTLSVRLACANDVTIENTETIPLPIPLGDITRYIVDPNGDTDEVVCDALIGCLQLPRGLTYLVRQGLLLFQEDVGGEYLLAAGEGVDGADVALVADDRLAAFQASFGGEAVSSRFAGWSEVDGCRVHQVSELPEGLEGVTQLQHTTRAPRPRLVGGIRVAGGYIWMPGMGPTIRSRGAQQVECVSDNGRQPCEQAEEPGDWYLPSGLMISPPAEVQVAATFEVELEEHRFTREGTTSIRFVAGGHGIRFKGPRSGRYWRESCEPEQEEHADQTAIPLDIATDDAAGSADLLDLDPSIRYLGPGLGEISLTPSSDHVWLAVGSRKNPRDLVFIGDLDNPVIPDGGESSHKGNRRTWSRTFTSAATRVSARIDNQYVGLGEDPRLARIYDLYQRRARRTLEVGSRRECSSAQLGMALAEDEHQHRPPPSDLALTVADAIAAFGVNQSGFPLREFQYLVERLVSKKDYLLWQQIIRAWAEAGWVDLLRSQDRSQTLVVPKSPRFMMVRRGPAVDAALVGLHSRAVMSTIAGVTRDLHKTLIPATSSFQPPVLRILQADADRIHQISQDIGLVEPCWLAMPKTDAPPERLRVGQHLSGFSMGAPPDAYRFDAIWDWKNNVFRGHRPAGKPELVEVERRCHQQRCSIYVVLLDGEAMFWGYIRSWALLRAAELRDEPPFNLSDEGVVCSGGKSPIHLPLPFGRLCAVLGAGLPGPILNAEGRVTGYEYPFGRAVQSLVKTLLPQAWLKEP